MCVNFFDDDFIIVITTAHITHFNCVLFSPLVIHHNLQVTNSIGMKK